MNYFGDVELNIFEILINILVNTNECHKTILNPSYSEKWQVNRLKLVFIRRTNECFFFSLMRNILLHCTEGHEWVSNYTPLKNDVK